MLSSITGVQAHRLCVMCEVYQIWVTTLLKKICQLWGLMPYYVMWQRIYFASSSSQNKMSSHLSHRESRDQMDQFASPLPQTLDLRDNTEVSCLPYVSLLSPGWKSMSECLTRVCLLLEIAVWIFLHWNGYKAHFRKLMEHRELQVPVLRT